MLLQSAKAITLGTAVSAISGIGLGYGTAVLQQRHFSADLGFTMLQQEKFFNYQCILQATNDVIKSDLKILSAHYHPSNQSLCLLHNDLTEEIIGIRLSTGKTSYNDTIIKMYKLLRKLESYANDLVRHILYRGTNYYCKVKHQQPLILGDWLTAMEYSTLSTVVLHIGHLNNSLFKENFSHQLNTLEHITIVGALAFTTQQLKDLLMRDNGEGLYSNELLYKKIMYTLYYKLSTVLEEWPQGMCQFDRQLMRNLLDAIPTIYKNPNMKHLLIKDDAGSFMVGNNIKRLVQYYLNNTFPLTCIFI